MEAENRDNAQAAVRARPWKAWVQVAAIAVVLLVISEALWVWQTWPVRELLQPTPTRPAGAP